MSGNKKVARNLVYVFASEGIGGVLSFLILLLCARLLGVDGFGVFSFILAITSVSQLVADFGLTNLIVREVAKDKQQATYIMSNVLTLAWCLSAVIFILVAGISFFMLETSEQWYASLIMAGAVLATYHSVVYSSVCRAFEEMGYNAFCFVVHKVVLISLVWWWGREGGGFTSPLLGICVAYLVANLLQYAFFVAVVRTRFIRFRLGFDWSFCFFLLKAAIPIGASMVVRRLTLQVDILVLTVMLGTVAVGVFNAAYKVVQIIDMIPFAICLPLFPALSRLAAGQPDTLQTFFNTCVTGFMVLSLPICGYLYISAENLILLFYGNDFAEAAILLKVLSFAVVGLFLNMLLSYLFVALQRQRFYLQAAFACLAVNTVVDLALVPVIGTIGAAYGTVFGELVYLLLAIHFLRRCHIRVNWVAQGWRPLLLTLACCSIVLIWQPSGIAQQLILTLLFAGGYGAGLFALRVISAEQLKRTLRTLAPDKKVQTSVQRAR